VVSGTGRRRLAGWVKQHGGILTGLLVLVALFWRLSPNFMVVGNLLNILLQVSITAILAFGMTYVLLLGEIDLSVGAALALVGTVAALGLQHGWWLGTVIPLALLAGLALGAINGILSSLLSIPSFIVTLATMGIFRGLAYIVSGGVPITVDNERFVSLGNGRLLTAPLPVWMLLVLLLGNQFILSKTVFGRKVYLAGGNREAALYSGINVPGLKVSIFMLSGLMAAIGGLLMTARLYSAQPNAGMGYELDAIAAAALGGTSLSGGYGTVTGTLVGALIIGVINNGMNLLSVPYFYQLIVKGIVILAAVCIDVQSRKHRS
jgi:ribose transport system permease protein